MRTYKICRDKSKAAQTHTTLPQQQLCYIPNLLLFKTNISISENISRLQGNHEQSPFTEKNFVWTVDVFQSFFENID